VNLEINPGTERQLSRWATLGVALTAVALGLAVLYRANQHPRTDDAEIFANFIGISPQVEGPIVHLNVQDNQFVKKGDLLFEIDERPYRYALEKTLSDQATLEGQIGDEQRRAGRQASKGGVDIRE
jgi:multidrug efflux system membrane fusion protein